MNKPREAPPPWRSDERFSDRDTIAAARKIWAASRPILGTPAEVYLRARKITADLDIVSLRYHPALFYRERPGVPSCTLPALVAAVTNFHGEVMGVHRTWLDPSRTDKARVPSPRRSLGTILGNGVRFGEIDDVVFVGEGIETVLSLKSALPDLPMVAALSAGHLAAWKFPRGLRRLIIACDNDDAGRQAARRLTERAEAAGISATTIVSRGADFNSDLRAMSAAAFHKRLSVSLGSCLASQPDRPLSLPWRPLACLMRRPAHASRHAVRPSPPC